MDEMEYPGIRVTMNANVGKLITPLKIDISTGDVITPRAIEFNYDLLLEDRSISYGRIIGNYISREVADGFSKGHLKHPNERFLRYTDAA